MSLIRCSLSFNVLAYFYRYYQTGRLTESSDVYSFEVVLLEVVTGELPILSGHGHIVHRVKQKIATGDLSSVADSRFRGAYDANSVWKVVETAMMCTADDTAQGQLWLPL